MEKDLKELFGEIQVLKDENSKLTKQIKLGG